MKQKILFFISFVSFIGYFCGLTLLISFGYSDLSRYYSIPIRIILSGLMFYIMVKISFKHLPENRLNYLLFWIFWLFYFLAIAKAMLNSKIDYYIPPFEFMAYSIIYSIIPFIFFSLRHSNDTLNVFKNAIIASGVLLAATTYYLYSSLLFSGVGRISMAKYMVGKDFAAISPLSLSYASSLVIAICLYYLAVTKLTKKVKLYYMIAIILSMVPFFLGASRGSVFALLITFAFVVFYQGSIKTKVKSIVVFIILGIGVMFMANYIGSSVITRVLSISENIDSQSSSTIRLDMWRSAWSQFLYSPIWGDSIQSKIPPHPHNIILEVLMSVGLLGFIPFVFLLVAAFKKSIQIIKYCPEQVWVFILFIQGFILNMFSGSLSTAIFFWAGMGLVFSVKIENEDQYQKVKIHSIDDDNMVVSHPI
ncbi:MAG: O-antigen ligase family protein [Prolixibacteraceae bacterium]|nr:O-antigen ligase family protein [Prolixibacteraceae bacterium]